MHSILQRRHTHPSGKWNLLPSTRLHALVAPLWSQFPRYCQPMLSGVFVVGKNAEVVNTLLRLQPLPVQEIIHAGGRLQRHKGCIPIFGGGCACARSCSSTWLSKGRAPWRHISRHVAGRWKQSLCIRALVSLRMPRSIRRSSSWEDLWASTMKPRSVLA